MKFKFYSLFFLGGLFLQHTYATIKRGTSVLNISLVDNNNKVSETAQEKNIDFNTSDFLKYIEAADEFFKQNNCNGVDDGPYRKPIEMYASYHYSINLLKKLGKVFGYKKHPAAPDEITAVDLSCPNVRRVCLAKIQSGENMDLFFEKYAVQQQTDNDEMNAKNEFLEKNDSMQNQEDCWELYKILRGSEEIFKQIEDNIDGNVTIPKSFVDLVFDATKKVLFDCSNRNKLAEKKSKGKYSEEEFDENLKEILSTLSGFQRIMSLVAEYLLCSDKISRSKIMVESVDGIPNAKEYRVRIVAKSKPRTLFHELGHVFHRRLGISLRNNIFANVSAVNSDRFDLVDKVFPLLKDGNMNSLVEEIEGNIKKTCKLHSDYISLRNNKLDQITEIAKRTVASGFGKILFGDGKSLKVEERLNDEESGINFIAKCIFLDAVILAADRRFESDGYRTGTNRFWNSFEELLTMQGFVFFLINGKYFMIDDRQEQHIFLIREYMSANTKQTSNKYWGSVERACYHSHSRVEFLSTIFEDISKKLSKLLDKKFDLSSYSPYEERSNETLSLSVDHFTPSTEKYWYTDEQIIKQYRKEKGVFNNDVDKFLIFGDLQPLSNYYTDGQIDTKYDELMNDLKNNKVFIDDSMMTLDSSLNGLKPILERMASDILGNTENLNNLITLCSSTQHTAENLFERAWELDVNLAEFILKNIHLESTYCLEKFLQLMSLRPTSEQQTMSTPGEMAAKPKRPEILVNSIGKMLVLKYLKQAKGNEKIKKKDLREFWSGIGEYFYYTDIENAISNLFSKESKDLDFQRFLKESDNLDFQRFLAVMYLGDKAKSEWMKPVLKGGTRRVCDIIKLKDKFGDEGNTAALRLIELLAESDRSILWMLFLELEDWSKFEEFCKIVAQKGGRNLSKPIVMNTLGCSNSLEICKLVLAQNNIELLNAFMEFFEDYAPNNRRRNYVNRVYEVAGNACLEELLSSGNLTSNVIRFFDLKPELFNSISVIWDYFKIFAKKNKSIDNKLWPLFFLNKDQLFKEFIESIKNHLKDVEFCLQNSELPDAYKEVLMKALTEAIKSDSGSDLFVEYIRLFSEENNFGDTLRPFFIKNAENLGKMKWNYLDGLAVIENYLKNGQSEMFTSMLKSMLAKTIQSDKNGELFLDYIRLFARGEEFVQNLESFFDNNDVLKLGECAIELNPSRFDDLEAIDNYLKNGQSAKLKSALEVASINITCCNLYDMDNYLGNGQSALKLALKSALAKTIQNDENGELFLNYIRLFARDKEFGENLEGVFKNEAEKLSKCVINRRSFNELIIDNYLKNGKSELKLVLKNMLAKTIQNDKNGELFMRYIRYFANDENFGKTLEGVLENETETLGKCEIKLSYWSDFEAIENYLANSKSEKLKLALKAALTKIELDPSFNDFEAIENYLKNSKSEKLKLTLETALTKAIQRDEKGKLFMSYIKCFARNQDFGNSLAPFFENEAATLDKCAIEVNDLCDLEPIDNYLGKGKSERLKSALENMLAKAIQNDEKGKRFLDYMQLFAGNKESYKNLECVFEKKVGKLGEMEWDCSWNIENYLIDNYLKNSQSDKLKLVLKNMLAKTIQSDKNGELFMSYIKRFAGNKEFGQGFEGVFENEAEKLGECTIGALYDEDLEAIDNYLENGRSNELKLVLKKVFTNTISGDSKNSLTISGWNYIKNRKLMNIEKLLVENKYSPEDIHTVPRL